MLQAQLVYYGGIASKLVKLVIALADTADGYVQRCSSLHASHKASIEKVSAEQAAANTQLEEQFADVSKLIVQDATRAALDEHLPQALQLLDQVLTRCCGPASLSLWHAVTPDSVCSCWPDSEPSPRRATMRRRDT